MRGYDTYDRPACRSCRSYSWETEPAPNTRFARPAFTKQPKPCIAQTFIGGAAKRDAVTSEPYHPLVDAVDEGLFHLDPQGCFVAVNEAFSEPTGYPRHRLEGGSRSLGRQSKLPMFHLIARRGGFPYTQREST